jgi:hypothetical protein
MLTINDWLWGGGSTMGPIAKEILNSWKRISQLPNPAIDPDWDELDSLIRIDLDRLCKSFGRLNRRAAKKVRDRIIEWYRARGIDLNAAQR